MHEQNFYIFLLFSWRLVDWLNKVGRNQACWSFTVDSFNKRGASVASRGTTNSHKTSLTPHPSSRSGSCDIIVSSKQCLCHSLMTTLIPQNVGIEFRTIKGSSQNTRVEIWGCHDLSLIMSSRSFLFREMLTHTITSPPPPWVMWT